MLRKVFPILALAMFSSTLGLGIINPLLPLYVRDMGATGAQLGLVVASFGATNSIAGPILGRLSDNHGRKNFLTIGLLCYAITSVGYVMATNIGLLSLVRALQGIVMGMTMPIATAYVGDMSPEGEEGKWMGYSQAAFFGGFAFGPLMGGVLTDHFGSAVAFYSMGALNLFAFMVVLFFLPEAAQHKQRTVSPLLSFKEMSGSQMVRGLFSLRMLQAVGRGATATFLPLFAAQHASLNTTEIGILLSASIFLIVGVSLPTGKLADKLNRKKMTLLGVALFIIATALFPLSQNFNQLLAIILLQSLGEGIFVPASTALTVEEGRRFGMGSTISILMMANSIGFAVGPVATGGIVDAMDINAAFYFSALMALIGSGAFLWFSRGYRHRHAGSLVSSSLPKGGGT